MPSDNARTDRPGREFPLLPLRGQVVFPHTAVQLEIGRDKSVAALDQALAADRKLIVSVQRDARQDEPGPDDIMPFGTLIRVKQVVNAPGGIVRAVFEGMSRARINDYLDTDPYFRVAVTLPREDRTETAETEVLVRAVTQRIEQMAKNHKKLPSEAVQALLALEDPGRIADVAAHYLNLKTEERQELLEELSVHQRLEKVYNLVLREVELLDLEKKINVRVRRQMERTQKEYYLREQMKAIQKELGERDDRASEVEELREKIEQAGMPEQAQERALKELDRLEKMPPMAAEAVVVRNYLDWLIALPWQKTTEDETDLAKAEAVLDADHYGLDQVKERILEHLAIRQLVEHSKSPIICLVGPPGVGKTSLGRSVAKALGREFVRISLGGVRDEAEIRGHRRTYVGAMPGRIIQGMKTAGTRNPVFLLDEIDKLASDFRGDPAAALLEVLDPEQNATFSDHYVEIPYDLSQVMFITTANVAYSIPRPLLDRMEVINLSGYTEEEKVEIARRHLLPKQRADNGLNDDQIDVSENTLRLIIREYTREAGVRNLERQLATVCRKAAREIVTGDAKSVRLTTSNLHKYLGAPRYTWGRAEKEPEIGVATGLSVSATGGDVMPIEVSVMKGSGKLQLTGRLGDVMKESAQAALSYIRARADQLGVDPDFYEKLDLHVHVPEGAIPKDGPSAGLALTTALISALTQRPVRNDVAMTGEVTLRGRALPIGGVKDKVLAAHRAGIGTVLLPVDNRKDVLEDVPATVQRRIEFVYVEDMDDVLGVALLTEPESDPDGSDVGDAALTLPPEAIDLGREPAHEHGGPTGGPA